MSPEGIEQGWNTRFSSVVALDSKKEQTGSEEERRNRLCTGTFLNQTTVLTAAHCVTAIPGRRARTVGMNVGQTWTSAVDGPGSLRIFKPNRYRYSVEEPDRTETLDVAIVVFPAGTAARVGVETFARVATSRPGDPHTDSIGLVGFGFSELVETPREANGIKRLGIGLPNNYRYDDRLVVVSGQVTDPRDSSGDNFYNHYIESGDSGGPLLLLTTPMQILGVASTGSEADRAGRAISVYPDLTNPDIQAFFRSTISCTGGPCAEDFLSP